MSRGSRPDDLQGGGEGRYQSSRDDGPPQPHPNMSDAGEVLDALLDARHRSREHVSPRPRRLDERHGIVVPAHTDADEGHRPRRAMPSTQMRTLSWAEGRSNLIWRGCLVSILLVVVLGLGLLSHAGAFARIANRTSTPRVVVVIVTATGAPTTAPTLTATPVIYLDPQLTINCLFPSAANSLCEVPKGAFLKDRQNPELSCSTDQDVAVTKFQNGKVRCKLSTSGCIPFDFIGDSVPSVGDAYAQVSDQEEILHC